MKQNKTHFEQVPLEVVKQIAHEEPETVPPVPSSTEGQSDWKELCKAIIVEEDPKRFTQLAEQLDQVLAQRGNPIPVDLRPGESAPEKRN